MGRDNRLCENQRLFGFLFVTLFEFVDPTCRIYQHVLTGKEGMGGVGNFQFDQGIFVAVFPLDRFPGIRTAAAQESSAITHVLENNEPIISRMDTFFHN